MLIKKGQRLKIKHTRKGDFIGIATKDFDSEEAEFWPINACEHVQGMSTDWEPGESISCRGAFVTGWLLCE